METNKNDAITREEFKEVMTNFSTAIAKKISEPIMSDSVAKLTEALSKAQGEIKSIPKHGEAKGVFNYKYATLDDCVNILNPILSNNGLCVTHIINDNKLYTTLHFGDEWIRSISSLNIPPKKYKDGKDIVIQNPLHERGGSITYLMRYHLIAIVCTTGGGDDDVQIPEPDYNPPYEQPYQPPKPKVEFDSQAAYQRIDDAMTDIRNSDKGYETKVDDLVALWTKEQYSLNKTRMSKDHLEKLSATKDELKVMFTEGFINQETKDDKVE